MKNNKILRQQGAPSSKSVDTLIRHSVAMLKSSPWDLLQTFYTVCNNHIITQWSITAPDSPQA